MACMDLDKLDLIGIQPLKDMLKEFGGWPVLEDNWDESNFKWYVVIENWAVPAQFDQRGSYTKLPCRS